ncbi:MFS transporter [Nocardioides sp. YIM 152588]|uniref:MFS transporter n=1 Tax=Nocardioides sp. YIM 152588 TaxID=3158259 RepID=UPI0032E3BDD6
MATDPARPAADRSTRRRLYAAGAVGTTLEWYDFAIFGTMAALIFDELFFPDLDPAVGTIAAFATFAAGFVARPLGGLVFSHYGDRLGRRGAMVASMMLMGVATAGMGLLPTYASIGIAAPALLTVLRFGQGLALGGEWGSSAALLVEHAPDGERGSYSRWVQFGGVLGPLLAMITVVALSLGLSEAQFEGWGWRLPFLFSAVLVVAGLYLRRTLPEAPDFEPAHDGDGRSGLPVMDAIRNQPRSLALVFFMHIASSTIAFTVAVYVLSYTTDELGMDRDAVLMLGILVMAVMVWPSMQVSRISDRLGRRPLFLTGSLLLAAIAFPFFWLLDTRNLALIGVALLLGSVTNAIMYMTGGVFFMELFPAEYRASGASLAVQAATVVAGGTAPMIAASLLAWSGGESWAISAYLLVIALVASAAAFLAPETAHTPAAAEVERGAGAPAAVTGV